MRWRRCAMRLWLSARGTTGRWRMWRRVGVLLEGDVMATVNEGNVVLFGAGGPVGAAAISALKDHYTFAGDRSSAYDRGRGVSAAESPCADSRGVGSAARESGCGYYGLRTGACCVRGYGCGD